MAHDLSRATKPWRAPAAVISSRVAMSAAAVQVQEVTTRRDRAAFVELPRHIYRDDPLWVAPLAIQSLQFIDPRRHPFYQHGAAVQFLGYVDGQVRGRVLVSDDPRYNGLHGTNLGCFGMFESIDDSRVAGELLDAAARWLRARGRTEMLGPIDYSTNYPCGLLVDGFQMPPRVMMNHHPPYYQRLFARWGLEKAKDLYAWWFTRDNRIDSEWRQRVTALTKRRGITVRPLRAGDYAAEVERCKQVYNESFENNWGFVRMTDAEFDHLAHELKQLARPELILLAEAEGRPVGLSITLPDLNEAIRPLRGRLTRWGLPVGLARMMYRMRKIKTARVAVLSVVKGFRCRGVAERMILDTFDYGSNVMGYTAAELSWTLEDNDLINRTIERVGGRRYKTYRIYRKRLD